MKIRGNFIFIVEENLLSWLLSLFFQIERALNGPNADLLFLFEVFIADLLVYGIR